MHRREVLKTMSGTLASWWWVPSGSVEAMALGRSVHAERRRQVAAGRHVFRVLDVQQNRIVTELAEMVLPETDTPGARDARVNEFIDLMLFEWMSEEERRAFLRGLARLDAASMRLAGVSFVNASEAQRVDLLRAQEQEAIASRPKAELAEGAAAATASPAEGPFFDVLKWLTLVGYYTSDVGMEEELHHEVFPGAYSGCAPKRPAH